MGGFDFLLAGERTERLRVPGRVNLRFGHEGHFTETTCSRGTLLSDFAFSVDVPAVPLDRACRTGTCAG
ncbi:hypothetical protein Misp02_70990 [Microtetraspora sp. NBRC 16547]|nr:hypothetical protein Misp02_70990 [Microtetraspora sp. NBRC 16547]